MYSFESSWMENVQITIRRTLKCQAPSILNLTSANPPSSPSTSTNPPIAHSRTPQSCGKGYRHITRTHHELHNGRRRQDPVCRGFNSSAVPQLTSTIRYPKHVWSPAGGWYGQPNNWKGNTLIAAGALAGVMAILFTISANVEKRPRMPEQGRFFPSRK